MKRRIGALPGLGRVCTTSLAILVCASCLACGLASQQRRERDRPLALAPVDEVEVSVFDGHRWNATVLVRGRLPDACTELGDVRRHRTGRDFEITLTTRRRASGDCGTGPEPYEKSLALYLDPGDFGQYRAIVNGVAASFYVSSDPRLRDGVTDFDVP